MPKRSRDEYTEDPSKRFKHWSCVKNASTMANMNPENVKKIGKTM